MKLRCCAGADSVSAHAAACAVRTISPDDTSAAATMLTVSTIAMPRKSMCPIPGSLPGSVRVRRALRKSVGEPSHPDVQDETKGRERRDNRRPSVTHEREGEAFDRRQAGGHGDVVEHLKRKTRDDAPDEIGADAILRQPRRLQGPDNHEQIQ